MSDSRKEKIEDEDLLQRVPDGKNKVFDGNTGNIEDSIPDYPIPEEWKQYNFKELYEAGWKAKQRKHGKSGALNISLRKGRSSEIHLGAFTDEKWELIQALFPQKLPEIPAKNVPATKKGAAPNNSDSTTDSMTTQDQDNMPGASYYKIPIAKATVIPKAFLPRRHTLDWFEELKLRGYPGDMNDFINDIIETHFSQCHNLFIKVVEKVRA